MIATGLMPDELRVLIITRVMRGETLVYSERADGIAWFCELNGMPRPDDASQLFTFVPDADLFSRIKGRFPGLAFDVKKAYAIKIAWEGNGWTPVVQAWDKSKQRCAEISADEIIAATFGQPATIEDEYLKDKWY